MPTYVTLSKLTQKGAADMKTLPQRIRANREMAQKYGGAIKGVYVALGHYDLITVFEAPNDEAAAVGAMMVAGAGNMSTETLRVFTEAEVEQLISQLPG